MIRRYQIVSGFVDEFEQQVNDLIRQGWQPYGSPIRDKYSCFYQAMTADHFASVESSRVYTQTDVIQP